MVQIKRIVSSLSDKLKDYHQIDTIEEEFVRYKKNNDNVPFIVGIEKLHDKGFKTIDFLLSVNYSIDEELQSQYSQGIGPKSDELFSTFIKSDFALRYYGNKFDSERNEQIEELYIMSVGDKNKIVDFTEIAISYLHSAVENKIELIRKINKLSQ